VTLSLDSSFPFSLIFPEQDSSRQKLELFARPVEDFLDSLGICVHFSGPSRREIEWIKNAGIRHLRDEICWEWIEKEQGKICIPENKRQWVEEVVKNDIEILMILNYANSIYPDLGIGSAENPDLDFNFFGKYVDHVVGEFHECIHQWEIWNEPNGFFFNGQYGGDWRGGGWVKHFARLSDKTLRRIRAIDPDAFVMVAGMEAPITDMLIPHLQGNYDAVAVHPYSHPLLPEYCWPGIARLWETMLASNMDIPIIITEHGFPTISGVGKFMWGFSSTISLKDQARFLLRSFAGNFMLGIPRTYWYDLVCDGTDKKEQEHNFGILNYGAETPRPAYEALKNMTDFLEKKSNFDSENVFSVIGRKASISFDRELSAPPRGLFLSKDSGHFYLILWKESFSKDLLEMDGTNPDLSVFHDDGNPEIARMTISSFSGGRMNARIIDPIEGKSSEKELKIFSQGTANVLDVTIKESPVIIEMTFR
jgi:hypothetical protein